MGRSHTRIALVIAALSVVVLATGCRGEGMPEPSPNEPSSAGLVESPKRYDGTVVTFTGEVVGEAMKRGDMAWLHINDDPYYRANVEEGAQLGGYNSGMAVWIAAAATDDIAHFGDYKHEGDIVTVEGTYHAACAEHGGDMDIHATALTVVEVGHGVVDEVRPAKVLWAIGLALLAAVLYVAQRLLAQPMSRHRR